MKQILSALALGFVLAGSACSSGQVQPDHSVAIASAIAETRPDYFTERDDWRQPQAILQLSGIGPGDHVADIGAGDAYFSDLLARLVGPKGSVLVQNPPVWIEKYGKGMNPHIDAVTAAMPQAQRSDVPFDDLGFAPGSLDAVTMMLIYHDVANLPADRAKMNREIYAALKPGGTLLVTDHSAEAGSGIRDTQTLHRIDAAVVQREIEAAGFKLVATSDIFANAQDDRSLSIFDPKIQHKTDRFVYLYRK